MTPANRYRLGWLLSAAIFGAGLLAIAYVGRQASQEAAQSHEPQNRGKTTSEPETPAEASTGRHRAKVEIWETRDALDLANWDDLGYQAGLDDAPPGPPLFRDADAAE